MHAGYINRAFVCTSKQIRSFVRFRNNNSTKINQSLEKDKSFPVFIFEEQVQPTDHLSFQFFEKRQTRMVKECGTTNYFLYLFKNNKIEHPDELVGSIAIPAKISSTQPQQENIQADCQFQSSRYKITSATASPDDNLISAKVELQLDDMPKSQYEKDEITAIKNRQAKLNRSSIHNDNEEVLSFIVHKSSLLNTPEEQIKWLQSTSTQERMFNGFCKWIYYSHKKVMKDVVKDVYKIMKNDPSLFQSIASNQKNQYGMPYQMSQAQEIEGTKYQQDHSGQRAFLYSKSNYLVIPGTTLTYNRIDQNVFFNSKLLIQNIEDSYQEAIIFNQTESNLNAESDAAKIKVVDKYRDKLDDSSLIKLSENKYCYFGGPVSSIERILNNIEGLNDQTIQKYNLTVNILIKDGFQICTSKTLMLEYCILNGIEYENCLINVNSVDYKMGESDEVFMREYIGCCVWFKGQLEGELDEGVWKFENVNLQDVVHNYKLS